MPFFLLATTPDTLWLIYTVTIVQFSLSAFFEPAQSAILPSLVQHDDLVEANTLLSVTWSIMLAVGAVAGGIFAAVFGVALALLFDAVTFVVAAGIIATIPYKAKRRLPLATPSGTSHEADRVVSEHETDDGQSEDLRFVEAVHYLWRNPQVGTTLLVKFGGSLANMDTVITLFATQLVVIAGNSELTLGLLYSIFGVGAFLGPVLASRVGDGSVHHMRLFIVAGFIAMSLSWFLLGAASTFALVAAAFFLRAIGGSVNWTYSNVIVQTLAPDEKLGRIFSMDMAGFQIATVIGTLTHGILVDLLGLSSIALICLLTACLTLIPTASWYAVVRRLARPEAAVTADTIA